MNTKYGAIAVPLLILITLGGRAAAAGPETPRIDCVIPLPEQPHAQLHMGRSNGAVDDPVPTPGLAQPERQPNGITLRQKRTLVDGKDYGRPFERDIGYVTGQELSSR